MDLDNKTKGLAAAFGTFVGYFFGIVFFGAGLGFLFGISAGFDNILGLFILGVCSIFNAMGVWVVCVEIKNAYKEASK